MTIQTKHFIELSDIAALRCTCKHCDATLSVLLTDEKLKTDNPRNMFLAECPNCRRCWADVGGSTYEIYVTRFTAALAQLQTTLKEPSQIGFTLTLEITADAVPGRGR